MRGDIEDGTDSGYDGGGGSTAEGSRAGSGSGVVLINGLDQTLIESRSGSRQTRRPAIYSASVYGTEASLQHSTGDPYAMDTVPPEGIDPEAQQNPNPRFLTP